MRCKILALLVFSFSLVFTIQAKVAPEVLARQAVSPNATESGPALAQLRTLGQDGLDTLFRTHYDEIKRHLDAGAVAAGLPETAEWQRIRTALDSVAQQTDSYAARLYWHTDLEQAKAAAKRSGKPILSLRLLGKLTDDFSCANSRFFRAALYANADVAQFLRENFILHWSTERAAPRITIDFGDGRKIERTITGNSIHYILDAQGRPIDALPGLYGPQAFLRSLQASLELFHELAAQPSDARAAVLLAYHNSRVTALNPAWAEDLKRAGVKIERAENTAVVANPTAAAAAPLAVTKKAVEMPLVREVNPDPGDLGAVTDEAAWEKVAALHLADAKLDNNSLALMARQLPPLLVNRKLTPEARLGVMAQNFERLMALDTVRNEHLLRARLHSWFTGGNINDVNELNQRVYAQLFLTPRTDAWLGLYGPDTYTGLDNGGIKP
jgi:hypothetical protein